MIDFVSTRQGTDAQTAACARLLAAVIAQAIRDACKPPGVDERRKDRNLDGEAWRALDFLFGAGPAFALYAGLIGSSAETIRAALRNKGCSAAMARRYDLSDMARRNLQWRLSRHATA